MFGASDVKPLGHCPAREQHAELKLKELSRSKERLEPSAAVERLERFAPATIFPKL
jgi:hypothetical protein